MLRLLPFALIISSNLWPNTSNPPLARTGAPTESTCAACHAGAAQPGGIVMEFGALAYTPGVKQTIRVNVWSANFSYTGMEITARLASNELQQAGHFEAGEFTSVRTQNGIEYVSQSVPTGTQVFTISWTPPATNVGNVRFYATGVTGVFTASAEPNAYAASYTMAPSSRDVPSGYRWQALDIPSLTSPSVTGISSDGKMTGTHGLAGTDHVAGAFVRDNSGAVTTFTPPSVNDGIFPTAINSSGKVVGYFYDGPRATAVLRGFIRDANGTFTSFSPPGVTGTQLLAINDAGLITGTADGAVIQLTTPPAFNVLESIQSVIRTAAVNNTGNTLQVALARLQRVALIRNNADAAGFDSCTVSFRGGSLDASINDSLDFTETCAAATVPFATFTYSAGTAGSSRRIILDVPVPDNALSRGITNAGEFVVRKSTAQYLLTPCTASPAPTFTVITAPASGGPVTIPISSAADCSANAVQESSWIHVSNTGQTGSVSVIADTNQTGASRTGTVWVAGSSVSISQPAAPCVTSLSGTTTFSSSGAGAILGIANSTSCSWTATSNVDWITFAGLTSGTGNGTVLYLIAPNNGTAARTGTITAGSGQLTITQAGAATCTFTVTPTDLQVPAAGATNAFSIVTGIGCAWTAAPPPFWITLTGASGNGPGQVTYTVAPNTSPNPRAATLTLAGTNITVYQSGVTASSSGLKMAPMPPCRVLETRPQYASSAYTGVYGPPYLPAGTTRTIPLTAFPGCPIPPNARAVVFNLTLIPRNGAPADFVTVYPAGEARPDFYSIRSPDGQIVANTAIVKLGANNAVSVYTSDDADVLLDAFAFFNDDVNLPNTAYFPMTPCRVVETRAAYRTPPGPYGPPTMSQGETRRFRFPGNGYCNVPAGAYAYSVTLTAVPPAPHAYITAWSAGLPQPIVSNMNSFAGRTLANNLVIPVSPDGSMDVFTYNASDIIIDINGYFGPDNGTGLFYYPVTQCRASDTRGTAFSAFPAPFGGPIMANGETRIFPIPTSTTRCSGLPVNAKAFVVNATAIPNGSPMPFLTMWDTGGNQPNASQLNAFEGQTVTNTAIVPAGPNGSINAYTYRQTHLVLDVSGYFGR